MWFYFSSGNKQGRCKGNAEKQNTFHIEINGRISDPKETCFFLFLYVFTFMCCVCILVGVRTNLCMRVCVNLRIQKPMANEVKQYELKRLLIESS